jgi:hypothetical protein
MRLYHYLGTRWALDDIRRRRLKASQIDDMNDPYEWKTVYSTHKASQSALETTERDAIGKYGVLCFSQRRNNILMWSHYADKHKGICLGFDVPDELTTKVKYFGDVVVVGNITYSDRLTKQRNKATYEEIINKSFWGKYSGWKYEEEVRMHRQRMEIDEETGYYFLNFNKRLKLKEVIAGVRFTMSKRPIEEALNVYPEDVKILKARRSAKTFDILVDENGFRQG